MPCSSLRPHLPSGRFQELHGGALRRRCPRRDQDAAPRRPQATLSAPHSLLPTPHSRSVFNRCQAVKVTSALASPAASSHRVTRAFPTDPPLPALPSRSLLPVVASRCAVFLIPLPLWAIHGSTVPIFTYRPSSSPDVISLAPCGMRYPARLLILLLCARADSLDLPQQHGCHHTHCLCAARRPLLCDGLRR